ncbi:methyltransferase domain-containing protein [Bacillus salacetis]|uniref:methyltransferase domain-containing protein n=1 Tax=Bacillus salacetis TaxID=2315464 RepID=UPI003B9EAE6B
MKELIRSNKDVLEMLDVLLQEQRTFDWDAFYTDRDKPVPFFEDLPDENLVEYVTKGMIKSGRVLELGCGPGRNAIYLAEKGFSVDAVDSSEQGIKWAKERSEYKKLDINFIQGNIFHLEFEERSYDVVYDSGCFHHIPPHRRMSYIDLVERALKPGGYFALTSFIEDGPLGGARISDWDVYRYKSMKGGLGYSEEKLKTIFGKFSPIEIRPMKEIEKAEGEFGVAGLIAGLFKKEE